MFESRAKDRMAVSSQGHRRGIRGRACIALLACSGLLVLSGAASQPSFAARADAATDWLLLHSNRDGRDRMYSLDASGQRLTPLFVPGRRLIPLAVSRGGDWIAYGGGGASEFGPLYVSRADGTGLRQVVRNARDPAFSPNGRRLAFIGKHGISIVGNDGRGLRRLTSRGDQAFYWSPDGKALVVIRMLARHFHGARFAVVVQPLYGKRRVLVRTGPNFDALPSEYEPTWSPDGHWIAYINRENNERRNGLTLVHPNGKGRHRASSRADEATILEWSPDGRWILFRTGPDSSNLFHLRPTGARHKLSAHAEGQVVWSPDGKKLAFPESGAIVVAQADGRGMRRLRNLSASGSRLTLPGLMWMPDGQRIVFISGRPRQIWVVGTGGQGLRRLTNEGENDLVGWTRLAPVLPPASPNPPTERVLGAHTVATSTPVEALSADGPRVAFVPQPTLTDCVHVVVWAAGNDLERLGHLPAPCSGRTTTGITPLVLAGSRAAWVSSGMEGGGCGFELESATLANPLPASVAFGNVQCSSDITHLRGDEDLLVFNDESAHPSWLVRIGVGGRRCGGVPCAALRTGTEATPVDSVSGALIAIKRRGAVTVLDDQGRLVRTFPFAPADVSAIRLDGTHLLVARSYTIESYDVATGALEVSRLLPMGYQLVDVDGGIAVLRRPQAVILLRLADGASSILTPGQGPVLANLEPAGLYYSYTLGGEGRVVFVPRSDLL